MFLSTITRPSATLSQKERDRALCVLDGELVRNPGGEYCSNYDFVEAGYRPVIVLWLRMIAGPDTQQRLHFR